MLSLSAGRWVFLLASDWIGPARTCGILSAQAATTPFAGLERALEKEKPGNATITSWLLLVVETTPGSRRAFGSFVAVWPRLQRRDWLGSDGPGESIANSTAFCSLSLVIVRCRRNAAVHQLPGCARSVLAFGAGGDALRMPRHRYKLLQPRHAVSCSGYLRVGWLASKHRQPVAFVGDLRSRIR